MQDASALASGTEAPDFELRDQHNQPVRLSDFRGRKQVLVVFFPFAFSRTCDEELRTLGAELADLPDDSVQLLGISVDSAFVLRQWSSQHDDPFPLLSDFWPHGHVARVYGVFDERVGVAQGGTFLIDTAGILRWRHVSDVAQGRPASLFGQAVAQLSRRP